MLKAFALRTELKDRKAGARQPPLAAADRRRRRHRAAPTPATSSSTWSSCSPTSPRLAGDLGVGIALFVDEMQDIARTGAGRAVRRLPRDQPAGRAADRGRRRPAAPAGRARRLQVVRRAAVPLRRRSTGCRARWPSAPGPCPRRPRTRRTTPKALDELYRLTDGYPYFVQAYGKVTWDVAVDVADPLGRRDAGGAGGRGRAGRRLLRRPLRPRHPGRARLHGGDGRPRRGHRRPRRQHRRGRPAARPASRSRSPRPATA